MQTENTEHKQTKKCKQKTLNTNKMQTERTEQKQNDMAFISNFKGKLIS